MSAQSRQTSARGAGRRRPLLVLVLVLTLIVLPIGALLIALHSETATRYAVRRVAANVDGLTLGNVQGTVGGGLTLDNLRYANSRIEVGIQRLHLSAALRALLRGKISVLTLTADGIRITPNPNAPVRPTAPFSVPELAAPLPLRIEQLRINDALWTPLPELPVQNLGATIEWRGTQLELTGVRATTPTIQATLEASLDTHGDVALTSQLDWSYPEPALRGQLLARGSLARLEIAHTLEGAYSVASQGTVSVLNRVEPFIDMTHHCVEPCVISDITIEQSRLTHRGTPNDSNIEATAQVSTGPLTRQLVRGDLHLASGQLEIRSLSTSGDGLKADLSGSLKDPRGTASGPAFSLTGKVAHLDAGLLHAAAAGRVTTNFTARGNDTQTFRAELNDIDGVINGYSVSGQGTVQRDGDRLIIDKASVKLGDNTLDVRGAASRTALNIDARVDLPALEQIDPRASGSIQARARLRGNLESPQVQASGNASSLSFDKTALASAQFELGIDAAGQVDGSATGRQLQQAQRDLGALDVSLDGSLDALGIAITLDHPQVNASLASTLSTAGDARLLTVERAKVDAGDIGEWTLQDAFEVSVTSGSLEIAPHLWQSGQAFARVNQLQTRQDEVNVSLELAQLPLALAAGFLPPEVSIAGTVDAHVDLDRRDGLWRGNVNWQQDSTVLKLRASDGSRRLALPVVSVQMEQTRNDASMALAIEGDFGLKVAANVRATNSTALGESPITGTLDANMQDVSWLTPWLGGVSDLAGKLQAKVAIGGQLGAPTASGSVTFEDGTLGYADAGLQLEQIGLEARTIQAGHVALEGSATSGGGALRFDGRITQPWTSARELELDVTGNDVQAFNAADYKLWLSPDLTLSASAEGASVSGDVRVPRADIRVRELPPNIVNRSDDIVVVGREVKERFALPFDGNLKVTLGEDVHVFALGLDADVGGDLRVRLDADKAPRLVGRIYLDEGRYAAYGQKLDIERGNLIYAGPIANPTLDIRAARQIDDAGASITAGVMVSGPASSPRISIFTDPATSDTDALSYLLLGRAADDTSGVEGEALSQAALAIGMSQSSPLTTRLASGLGLDELTVDGDSVEAAELVAGKQINDRLYIRYRYGVFSNLGAILLRYRLSRRLALEAGSSDVQSLDVLYTIEK